MRGADSNLLEQARAAGARLAAAERDVLLARADYHVAVRRLHLAGAPLRDIAEELSMSHQRVQQIVAAAGGSWWLVWRRRGATRDAICTWCGRPPAEVHKLIAGPRVYICDACIGAAERAMESGFDERGSLQRVSGGRGHRCAFCAKRAGVDRPVVTGPSNICFQCLRACREILDSRVM